MNNTNQKTKQDFEGEAFSFYLSDTQSIRVGCGNLYVTICYDDRRRFKRLFIWRNSKFFCPITTRYAIQRLATFGGKRNLKQTIKDLRGERPLIGKAGHYCDKYNITAKATSCFDGVSQILEQWLKTKRKKINKDGKKTKKEAA